MRRLKSFGQVVPLRYLETSFGRLTAEQASVAYDQSLVIVDAMLRRPGLDWNGLFRALTDSPRTEYTLDNFGLRYSELEDEIARAISPTTAARSR